MNWVIFLMICPKKRSSYLETCQRQWTRAEKQDLLETAWKGNASGEVIHHKEEQLNLLSKSLIYIVIGRDDMHK